MTHAKFTAAAGSMMRSEAIFRINNKVARLRGRKGMCVYVFFGNEHVFGHLGFCAVYKSVCLFVFAICFLF